MKQTNILLSRNEFRKSVFKRDGYKCIVCTQKATYDNKGEVDNLQVHHIIERRLFVTISQLGGYFLNNGISLCDKGLDGSEGCHYKAEQTLISCDELRKLAGIEIVLLPENLYKDEIYDKWGNLILPNGRRTKGPLFHDESVQKVLAPVLHLFDDYVKYPRTYHLPFSPGTTKDDRVLKDCSNFFGKEVVVLTKMDGENCLHPDTKIKTLNGDKTIQEICETEFKEPILTFNIKENKIELDIIENFITTNTNSSDEWFELELENNIKIKLTGNHYVWVVNKMIYKRVKHLQEEDEVLLLHE